MKVNWNSKYNTISVYALIVICCSIIFYFVASQIGSFSEKISILIGILYPFIIGFAIAYLLNFILKFYEHTILDNVHIKIADSYATSFHVNKDDAINHHIEASMTGVIIKED